MTTHQEPMEEGNALERGLRVLERIDDPELAAAYRQYMERIETLVGRVHVDTYSLRGRESTNTAAGSSRSSTARPRRTRSTLRSLHEPALGARADGSCPGAWRRGRATTGGLIPSSDEGLTSP